MQAINIKAFAADISQIEALKVFMKALKIKFEVSKEETYDLEFVKMVEKGEKQITEGKGIKMDVKEFKRFTFVKNHIGI